MELGLSLGVDCSNSSNTVSSTAKPFGFSTNHGPDQVHHPGERKGIDDSGLGLGFCMALVANPNDSPNVENHADADNNNDDDDNEKDDDRTSSEHTREDPLQLDLLLRAPVPRRAQPRRRWSSENGSSGSSGNLGAPARGFDVSRLLLVGGAAEEVSSPNRAASSFQIDLSIFRGGGGGNLVVNGGNKRDLAGGPNDVVELERGSSRASDEDENGLNSRKKLRLTKEQSAYIEESFKEHNTLNPKQKLALAKQLNLRPRQVEVWFQNRRARTKLKQTEVDCEYLKRCCETLTEENRRLHKELQELRALKTHNHPYYMQLPASTLNMCPSCERVATTSTAPPSTFASSNPATTTTTDSTPNAIPFPITTRPMFCPLSQPTNYPHQSAAS